MRLCRDEGSFVYVSVWVSMLIVGEIRLGYIYMDEVAL
jgi:hypothetical protein